jgi:hypothetical protein
MPASLKRKLRKKEKEENGEKVRRQKSCVTFHSNFPFLSMEQHGINFALFA